MPKLRVPEEFSMPDQASSRRQDAEGTLFAQLAAIPFIGSRVSVQAVVTGAPADLTLTHALGYKARGYWVTNVLHAAAASGYRSPTRYPVANGTTIIDDAQRLTLRFGDNGTYTLEVF